jgi:hypothetical protein
VNKQAPFDPYALFAALEGQRVGYVVIGAFARVVHGSAEITNGLDVVPSLHPDNLRRVERALDELGADGFHLTETLALLEPATAQTPAGELRFVPEPWGTRGYDDLRIRANRDNLGRGARPAIASIVDCVRMLDASERARDAERLLRLRRMMERERELVPRRGRSIER